MRSTCEWIGGRREAKVTEKLSGGECAKRTANRETHNFILPVAMRLGDTPVLIPNTMVKTQAADGTMLETAWESRWLPDSHGGIAQLGEHLPCKQGVKGSNPFISTEERAKRVLLQKSLIS